MKIAVVEFSNPAISCISDTKQLTMKLEEFLKEATKNDVDILVLPGFTGCYYQWLQQSKPKTKQFMANITHEEFLEEMTLLSKKYNITLCPGTYWERVESLTYHSSCLVDNTKLLLKQSQLYLAKWERELLLSRGKDIQLVELKGWKIAIILSTDVFYPQVARRAALFGADLILSPIGFVGEKNKWLQISGTWQTTQLNHFFAVESAFNGKLGEEFLWGESIIHAPIPMTPGENGILARTLGEKEMIIGILNKEHRTLARREFDALTQLNPEFYAEIQGLGGRRND